MSADHFLDTNIFVYTFDRNSPQKRDRASDLVSSALETQRGVISWQVVQEFLNVALHRFAVPMTAHEADDYLTTVLSPMCRVFPTAQLFRDAIVLQLETRFRFYDTLIVASVVAAGTEILYSEDLQHGRKIRGVKILDPFR